MRGQRSVKHNDRRNFKVIKVKSENGKNIMYKHINYERCPICLSRIQYIGVKKYCFSCNKETSVTIQ